MQDASGRRFVCQTIMAGIFGLPSLIASFSKNKPENLYREVDGVPVIKKCDPLLEIPDSIPHWTQILLHIAQQIEDVIYDKIEELIMEPVRRVLEAIVNSCADKQDEDFGSLPPDALGNIDAPLVGDKFIGTNTDPRNFLESLFAILTPSEICQLCNGTAKLDLMVDVKAFVQREFPDFYNIFSTNEKLLAFFKNIGTQLDLTACARLGAPQPGAQLEDLCRDGETLRQTALRESLRAKGLSEEEIDAQLELDKELKSKQIADAVNLMTFGQSSNRDIDMDLGNLMGNTEAVSTANKYAIDTVINPIEGTFSTDVATFVPVMYDEVQKLIAKGLEITEIPLKGVFAGAERSMYSQLGGEGVFGVGTKSYSRPHRWRMYAPRFELTEPQRDMVPGSPTFGKIIPGTADFNPFCGGETVPRRNFFLVWFPVLVLHGNWS